MLDQSWPPGSSLPAPAVCAHVWAWDRLLFLLPIGPPQSTSRLSRFLQKYMPFEIAISTSAWTQHHSWKRRHSEDSSCWSQAADQNWTTPSSTWPVTLLKPAWAVYPVKTIPFCHNKPWNHVKVPLKHLNRKKKRPCKNLACLLLLLNGIGLSCC